MSIWGLKSGAELELIFARGQEHERRTLAAIAAREAAEARLLAERAQKGKRWARMAAREVLLIPLESRLARFKAEKARKYRAALLTGPQEFEKRLRAERSANERKRLAEARAQILARRNEAWPIEKQRRSNIDWEALVPEHIAARQIAFERNKTAHALRKTGKTLRDVGLAFGVGQERARQMIAAAERAKASPAEGYLVRSVRLERPEEEAGMIATLAALTSPFRRDWMFL